MRENLRNFALNPCSSEVWVCVSGWGNTLTDVTSENQHRDAYETWDQNQPHLKCVCAGLDLGLVDGGRHRVLLPFRCS